MPVEYKSMTEGRDTNYSIIPGASHISGLAQEAASPVVCGEHVHSLLCKTGSSFLGLNVSCGSAPVATGKEKHGKKKSQTCFAVIQIIILHPE